MIVIIKVISCLIALLVFHCIAKKMDAEIIIVPFFGSTLRIDLVLLAYLSMLFICLI